MQDDSSFQYLKLQYEEGARIVRYWIECRYKILQFVGYFNAAVLTFGFSQGVLLASDKTTAGVALCGLCMFVALMGLATEFSVSSYNYGYFESLRTIETRLAQRGETGIITHSKSVIAGNRFHKVLPVHRAHKIFYVVLIAFWAVLLVRQATLPNPPVSTNTQPAEQAISTLPKAHSLQ